MRLSIFVFLALFFACGLVSAGQASPATDQAILQAVIAASESQTEQEELCAIYAETDNQPLWAMPARRLGLLKILAGLEADGIDIARLGILPGSGRSSQLEDDIFATRALLRAAHLVTGNAIDATSIPGWHIKRPQIDVVPTIVAALREDRLGILLHDLRPQHTAYTRLRSAYIHYRRLALEPWRSIDTSGPRIVEPSDPRMLDVAQLLVLLGDLKDSETNEAAMTAGIVRFQTRHGLEPDGRVGPATLAQLNVAPAARAAQIAANLEYWRLLPREWPIRYVAVNAAAAHLEVVSDGKISFATRVIVGDPDHPTPVTDAIITAVTFNPPWTIPFSIATKEILPKLRRDPSYLEHNAIEIVGRNDDPHGLQLDWAQYSRSNFPFQLRQVPGPGNALGLLKFEMPNRFDVYLHDTPNRSLFEKNARALSHGCVRVQCARELAEHLIDDPSVWIATNLVSAIQEGRTHRVPLKEPLPVFLLYFTAFVDKGGTLNFRPDIYGRDKAVMGAPARHVVSLVSLSKGP